MNKLRLIAAAIPVLLAGCGEPDRSTQAANDMAGPTQDATPTGNNMAATAQRVVAPLQTAEGAAAGQAVATPADGGVMLALRVEGLPPGQHGAHVHTTGRCDAPSFESAGGHWNPTNAQHGLEDPAGQHAGDMPNLVVGQDGRGTLSYQLQGATFDGLLEGDGSAMMIHAGPDDQRTDPSGDSGSRIACGVFTAG